MTRDEKYRQTRARNRAYQTRRALRIIRRVQPETVEELRKVLGTPVIEVGQGAFRTAYRINGTSLLVKFPLMYNHRTDGGEDNWTDRDGKNHTRMEVKKIRVLSGYAFMKKHLPPVHYFNGRDGVLVTTYYRKARWVHSATHNLLSKMVKEFCGVVLGDMSPDNLRTQYGRLIFIDCGY